METISPELQGVIEKAQKLLNLAAKNPNEHEAAAATAKAMKMLAEHNLDVATVEKESNKEGRREELKVDGGYYSYQRALWKSVAELNFCIYWAQQYVTKGKRYVSRITGKGIKSSDPDAIYVSQDVLRWRHCLVGRVVNTRSTVVMTQYLQQAIERVTVENIRGRDNSYHLSTYAVSFRKGCAARIIEMVEDQRESQLATDREKERKAKRAGAGVSVSRAMTISTFSDAETDANNDFRYGEGWSARQAARRAERAAEREERIRRWTEWCAANPEEARKLVEEERKREERNAKQRDRYIPRGRGNGGSSDKTDYSAYYAGYDAGGKISIHQQAQAPTKRERIAGPKAIHL